MGIFNHLRLSPDQKRVAISRVEPQLGSGNIWLLEFARGISSPFTFGQGNKSLPVWSPDGSRIAWSAVQGGSINVYRKVASGDGRDEPLVMSATLKYAWDCSPDGRYLVYSATDGSSEHRDLWAAPIEGDGKPVRVVESNFHKDQAQFSPDGRWLAYASNMSGNPQVYVQRFQPGGPAAGGGSGGKWQISTVGGFQPRWRRDGKELFYLTLDRKIMAVPVQTGGSFQAGAPSALFQIRNMPSTFDWSYQYDVTADGGRFLVRSFTGSSTSVPLTVVLNWAAGVKK